VSAPISIRDAPRWMARLDWLDFRPEAPERELIWKKFIHQLNTTYQRVRTPFTVPALSNRVVERHVELDTALNLILDDARENPVATTVAFQGSGGFGKSVLANMLCVHESIQRAFSDGILWITLGENPDILRLALNHIEYLTGEPTSLTDVDVAVKRLDDIVSEREMLFVLDDVWRESDALSFIRTGRHCAKLLTTRRQDIAVALDARIVTVGEMHTDEATQLLVGWIEPPPDDRKPFETLAHELGEWPLLLSLVSAHLREAIIADHSPLDRALEGVRRRLARRGFTAFDRTDEQQRNRAISISLEVSLDRLKHWRERYLELAILSPDINIPFQTVEQLWRATAGLDDLDTDDGLMAMQRLSLFASYDTSQRTLRLHDVIASYLASILAEPTRVHQRLVEAWGHAHSLPDTYAWQNYLYHLLRAGHFAQATDLLLDYSWIEAKLTATDIFDLLADYVQLATQPMPDEGRGKQLQHIAQALQLSAHILVVHKEQLWNQLQGRQAALTGFDTAFLPDHPSTEN
jgi:hypothetical protein